MPLLEGSDSQTISENISRLIEEGYNVKQASAIAYKEAGREVKKASYEYGFDRKDLVEEGEVKTPERDFIEFAFDKFKVCTSERLSDKFVSGSLDSSEYKEGERTIKRNNLYVMIRKMGQTFPENEQPNQPNNAFLDLQSKPIEAWGLHEAKQALAFLSAIKQYEESNTGFFGELSASYDLEHVLSMKDLEQSTYSMGLSFCLLTKEFAEEFLMKQAKELGFPVELVGSLSKFGLSYSDMDVAFQVEKVGQMQDFFQFLKDKGFTFVPKNESKVQNLRRKQFAKKVGNYNLFLDVYLEFNKQADCEEIEAW